MYIPLTNRVLFELELRVTFILHNEYGNGIDEELIVGGGICILTRGVIALFPYGPRRLRATHRARHTGRARFSISIRKNVLAFLGREPKGAQITVIISVIRDGGIIEKNILLEKI